MKSNVPWSVKGIDPEARLVAKEAAKKAGMTLGEWMNQAIREVGTGEPEDEVSEARARITSEQLRAVVDTLNRLHERLQSTEKAVKTSEERSRRTVDGLSQGLEAVFERVKRVEAEKMGADGGLAERLDKIERGEGDRSRVNSLKALEGALGSIVDVLEATRREAIGRIGENESAIAALAGRMDVFDEKLASGFGEVHGALGAIEENLERTERAAEGAIAQAQEAAGSTDEEFVEQTSKRLQILGNEIKRSGDQIRHVEEMIGRLSDKIEAAEHRSAEGIGDVAEALETLRGEFMSRQAGEDAAAAAEERVAKVQQSYEAMIARLEGRAASEAEAPAGSDADADDSDFDAVFGDNAPAATDMPFGADDRAARSSEDAPTLDHDAAGEDSRPIGQRMVAAAKARLGRTGVQDETGGALPAEGPEQAQRPAGGPFSRLPLGKALNPRIGLPLVGMLGLLLAALAVAGSLVLGEDESGPAAQAPTAAARPSAALPIREAAPAESAFDAQAAYGQAEALLAAGRPEEAIPLLEEAAAADFVPAWFRLGHAHYEGLGVDRDLTEARRWLMDAALEGNVLSMHLMGTIEINDPARSRNLEAAVTWYEQAASYGVIDSMYNLGYLHDPSAPENPMPESQRSAETAYFWYSLAAQRGDVPAKADAQALAGRLRQDRIDAIDADIALWSPLPLDNAVNDGLSLPG